MPGKVYMGIDFRRDHSFRIPRPDLTQKIGTPNACNGCHGDKPPAWADAWITKWHGPERRFHFGEVMAALQKGETDAETKAARYAGDTALPAFARATLLDFLGSYSGAASGGALHKGLKDSDPLVRHAALDGLANRPQPEDAAAAIPLLRDPVRAVRIAAARSLLAASPEIRAQAPKSALEAAHREYRRSLDFNADSPNGRFNLGIYHERLEAHPHALKEYREALALDSLFLPARVNLANLLHRMGNSAEAEAHFREVIRIQPGFGDGHYSLGLLLAGIGKLEEAAIHLEKASRLLKGNARVAYNLGLAYQRLGKKPKALEALRAAEALSPGTPDYLWALALFHMQQDQWKQAMEYARSFERIQPGRQVADLIRRIEGRRKPAP
jgi:tetratricopeptide (TPR) repeat protein